MSLEMLLLVQVGLTPGRWLHALLLQGVEMLLLAQAGLTLGIVGVAVMLLFARIGAVEKRLDRIEEKLDVLIRHVPGIKPVTSERQEAQS